MSAKLDVDKKRLQFIIANSLNNPNEDIDVSSEPRCLKLRHPAPFFNGVTTKSGPRSIYKAECISFYESGFWAPFSNGVTVSDFVLGSTALPILGLFRRLAIMKYTIEHNKNQQRFETTFEHSLCVIDYELDTSVLALTHVSVPAEVEGRGIAGQLTQAALDWARAENYRVRPVCPYVQTWLLRHPEYRDLVEA